MCKNFLIPVYLIAISFFTLSSITVFSQGFEGKITYQISYENLPPAMQGMANMLPKENFLYLKNQQTRLETPMMGGSQIIIFNEKSQSGLMLTNMQTIKWAVKVSPEDKAAFSPAQKPQVSYLNEYKTIAGYRCQKANIRIAQPNGTTKTQTVYVTKEIQGQLQSFDYLDGIPLAYDDLQNGMTVKVRAAKIEKTKISDNTFSLAIPAGYQEKTMAEIMQIQRK